MIARAYCWLKGHSPLCRHPPLSIMAHRQSVGVNVCDRCGSVYAKLDRQTHTQWGWAFFIGMFRNFAAALAAALIGLWLVVTGADDGETATVVAGGITAGMAAAMACLTDRAARKEIDDKTASS